MTPPDIGRAVELLRAGQLVAFPTETVYGLGADALNAEAVARIFAAKQRPPHHPLIVHLAGAAFLDLWAHPVPAAARRLAEAFWPGPLTLILKRQRRVPDVVTGGQDTVGLRVPDHRIALDMLARFAGGVAAPSANRHGRISPTTAAHVRAELGDRVPLILDGGPCQVGIESTILDLSRAQPAILRPGAIAAADIADVIGALPAAGPRDEDDAPRVSGSLPGHYAPRTPLRLVAPEDMPHEVASRIAQGLRIGVLASHARAVHHPEVLWQRALPDVRTYAHDLYAHLRRFDGAGLDLIVVEATPQTVEWLAVNDRLQRAAAGSGEEEP